MPKDTTTTTDIINNPKHYSGDTINMVIYDPETGEAFEEVAVAVEVVDVIEAFVPNNSHIAHALTYLLRAGAKVPEGMTQEEAVKKDYGKAQWWIRRRIDYLGGDDNVPTVDA